jgi:hypothetical protein
MTPDQAMWAAGFMPEWLKSELRSLMVPMTLPPFLGGPPHEREEWKLFRDGTYAVSSMGNVRRAKPGVGTFVGRPVRPAIAPGGYAQASLSIAGRMKRFYVHRMVAEAFLGPCTIGHVVNHIDANKQNNQRSNLEYVTHRENVRHAMRVVGRRSGPTKPKAPKVGPQTGDAHWSRRMPERVARGERMPSKVTEADVVAMRRRVASGETQASIASEYGISVAQMSRIVRGKRWAHVPKAGVSNDE